MIALSGVESYAQYSRRPDPIPDLSRPELNGREIIFSADEFLRAADRATIYRTGGGMRARNERDIYASAYAYGMSGQRLGTELEVCRNLRRCANSQRVLDLLTEVHMNQSDFESRSARWPLGGMAASRMDERARILRRQISDVEALIEDFNRPLPPPPPAPRPIPPRPQPPRPLPEPTRPLPPRGPQVRSSGTMRVQARFDHAYYLNIQGEQVFWNHAAGAKGIGEVGTDFISDSIMPMDRDVEARIRVIRNPGLQSHEQAQVTDGRRSLENEWLPVTAFNRNTLSVMVVEPAGGAQLVVLEIEWRAMR
ncbi:MAG: hypothetical protein K2X47_12140 [Bdellovibrionales bacterium]|nr:hypothetical protein [Bdellovibrionales bacterium]